MANSYAIATSVVAGRNKIYDANLPFAITLSMMSVSSDVDQQWDIFLDQLVNNLLLPAQPGLTAATTGGTIPASTKMYVRITSLVVDATQLDGYLEGQPCVAGKTVTTAATTATNKVTVAITAVTGAAGYRIYVGTSPGYEALAGQIIGATSFVLTAMPLDTTRGVPTMPDISIKIASGVAMALPVGGQSVLVGAHVTVFCTAGTAGTAYFSMIGA